LFLNSALPRISAGVFAASARKAGVVIAAVVSLAWSSVRAETSGLSGTILCRIAAT